MKVGFHHLPVLPQVFQADLHVQFPAARNDVLAALFGAANHQLVGFREPLQAFHQFGEVLTILEKLGIILQNWSWEGFFLCLGGLIGCELIRVYLLIDVDS